MAQVVQGHHVIPQAIYDLTNAPSQKRPFLEELVKLDIDALGRDGSFVLHRRH